MKRVGKRNLLAVFVGNDIPFCSSCICTEDDSISEKASNNGGSCTSGFGQRETLVG